MQGKSAVFAVHLKGMLINSSHNKHNSTIKKRQNGGGLYDIKGGDHG